MIKARAGNLLLLGLSHANLDRLRADGLNGAIRIKGKDIGLPIEIWITAAETEDAIARMLLESKLVTAQTEIIDTRHPSSVHKPMDEKPGE